MREAGSALAGVAAVGLVLALAARGASAEKATVIELTQIPCQFIGSENGVDHGFTTTKKADHAAPLRAKGQSAPPGPFSGIMGAPVGSMGWGAGKRGSRR